MKEKLYQLATRTRDYKHTPEWIVYIIDWLRYEVLWNEDTNGWFN